MKKEMYDVDLIKPDGSVKKIQTSEKMDDNTCYVEVKTDGSFPYNSGRGVGKILYKPTIEFPRVITTYTEIDTSTKGVVDGYHPVKFSNHITEYLNSELPDDAQKRVYLKSSSPTKFNIMINDDVCGVIYIGDYSRYYRTSRIKHIEVDEEVFPVGTNMILQDLCIGNFILVLPNTTALNIRVIFLDDNIEECEKKSKFRKIDNYFNKIYGEGYYETTQAMNIDRNLDPEKGRDYKMLKTANYLNQMVGTDAVLFVAPRDLEFDKDIVFDYLHKICLSYNIISFYMFDNGEIYSNYKEKIVY